MTSPARPCPFTLAEYRSLIRLAGERFSFRDFENFDGDNQILWRHDVEYSLHEMDKIARIDCEERIPAVLFVQVRSPFYNGLSAYARRLFRDWLAGGLRIGLHFDWEYFADDLDHIDRHLSTERAKVEDLLGIPVRCFSYHNPTESVLSYTDDMAGMINAYHPRFFLGEGVHYISDSNGRWRTRNLRDVLSDPAVARLQVNLHDTWWTEDRVPQIAKIDKAFAADAQWKSAFYRTHANVIVDQVI
jgi:hypothetical protein